EESNLPAEQAVNKRNHQVFGLVVFLFKRFPMYLKRLEDIDVNFNDYEVGLERYVRCTWGLNM
ncbi:hypothetical protein EAY40_26820, partial [Vibrio anguillarum]|nr:hypothetical protein [Vibrio anguillarum]